ncbi:hypothetical protein V6N13_109765 [Hibiscus sabdariffa]
MQDLLGKVQLVTGTLDKLVWMHDTIGTFSVKKLFNLLQEIDLNDLDFELGKIWDLKVPPKIRNCFAHGVI